MYSLTNKTILIISQQSWGKMFVSKHHYAAELARRGNKVYFLNPPNYQDKNFIETVEIVPSNYHPDLYIVNDNIDFPYNLKFHFKGLFHLLIKRHIRAILKKIKAPVDIVWSFDLAHVYPLQYFPSKALKIFHPVDDPLNRTGIGAASGAQYIFSTANEILKKYESYKVSKYFINHGISEAFLFNEKMLKTTATIRVGFSGNLLREDIDRNTLLKIITENPSILFECWGGYEFKDTNVGGANDSAAVQFIETLKAKTNVILHGAVPADQLPAGLRRMDAFLICYDLTVENRNGPNYHKLLEYISTGKVVVSNYICVYKDMPQFVQMVSEATHNRELPALFQKVIGNLQFYNSPELEKQRIEFAKDNTYPKQIDRIEAILSTSK